MPSHSGPFINGAQQRPLVTAPSSASPRWARPTWAAGARAAARPELDEVVRSRYNFGSWPALAVSS